MLTLTGHLSPADKETGDYAYVPFDVPPGTARIDVRYRYSHPRHHGDFEGAGNTIDLGLFDANGYEFLNAKGFRGWSGSDRDHIWIGATDAETAPGYLSGPLPAGIWHVILGLYRIADEGCDWTITIELHGGEKVDEYPSQRVDEAAPTLEGNYRTDSARVLVSSSTRLPARWYRGDLQSHTHHSDGKGSLATLVATARARRLDFLAVTDHNTISHIREYANFPADRHDSPLRRSERGGVRDDPLLLLIPATEVTTYYGHLNVWGIRDWVDFRCGDPHTMAQIIDAAHAQGALASVNHPKTGGPEWEYGGDLPFDCIEVWQAPWPFYNTEAFAWWESLLMQGRRIIAVGGSDYHQPLNVMEGNPHLPGHPTTWVYANSLTTESILDGIRRGRVFISADVDGPMLYFTASTPDSSLASFSAKEGIAGEEGERRDYLPGDVVGQSGALDVTCEVRGGAGYFARIIADGAVIDELPIEGANWQYTWRSLARPKLYVRAEVIIRPTGDSDWVMAACSNPLYF